MPMNNVRVFICALICVIITQNTFSQHYVIKSYFVENGLPTRIVNDACQDTNGYMWFATYSGISSFDGFRFTNYDGENGIPHQHYRKVFCDQKGIVWGIPYDASDSIVYLDGKTWKRLIPARSKQRCDVFAAEIMYNGDSPVICLGTTSGIYLYQDSKWVHQDVSKEQSKNQILCIESNNGRFYILTREALYTFSTGGRGWNLAEYLRPVQAISSIRFEHPGTPEEKLWLLFNDHLSYRQNGKTVLYADGFKLTEPEVARNAYIDFDLQGNIFVGTSWGKFFIGSNHGQVRPLKVANGFSADGATSMFIDREQNVWFTDTRGIDKVGNLLILNYFENDGLLENEVTAIAELKNGDIVFGHNNGLTLYQNHTFTRLPFPGKKDNISRVLDIMTAKDGSVWFASSSNGFGRLSPSGKIRWYNAESTLSATSVYQDDTGRIWLATNRTVYYIQNDKLVDVANGLGTISLVRKMFSDGHGGILCAGIIGSYLISGNKIFPVPAANEIKTESFYSFFQSAEGETYVASLEGLGIMEHGKIQKFRKDGFSIDFPIYFILQDKARQFWLGSNTGVFRWDGNKSIASYNIHNGLAGRESNRSAGIVDSKGRVWIGLDMGSSCFLPGFSDKKSPSPKVKLLGIEIKEGEIQSLDEEVSFQNNDNTIFFHFRGVSFINEDLMRYRYKLEGMDKNWQYLAQSSLDKVKYTNLHPGTYHFIVQARNDMGNWSEVVKSGAITIKPMYFETLLFKVLRLVALILIVVGVFKIILQRKYSHKLENEITERRLSQEKLVQTLDALHVSELKFRDVIEFAVDGIVMGSKAGKITDANSYMLQLTGRNAEGLIGIPIDALFTQDQLKKVPLKYDLLEKGEMVVSRRDIIRPDGTAVPVEMHTKMMPDGSYQSICHDITNRIRAEKNLRESRELYKLIADKMTDVVWLMDLTGKSIFVSNSIEQFTGFSVEEYLQQTIDDRFTPSSAQRGKSLFYSEISRFAAQPDALQGYSSIQHMEYRCKDGRTKWGELLMTPYLGPENKWLGIHGVTRDITDRKHLEKILQEKATELERFNNLMIGRELKMMQLKKEVNDLLKDAGQTEKYQIHE